MVDSVTRSAFPNRILQYHYTILNTSAGNNDTVSLKNEIKTQLTDRLRSDPRYKTTDQSKVTMFMKYFDTTDHYLFSVLITPTDIEE
jgi:hypothetical protein